MSWKADIGGDEQTIIEMWSFNVEYNNSDVPYSKSVGQKLSDTRCA